MDVLKVCEAFTNEDNFTVWSDLNKNLSQIALLIQYTDYYTDYKSFAKKLFGPLGERLGWDAKPSEGTKWNLSLFKGGENNNMICKPHRRVKIYLQICCMQEKQLLENA